jgi:hypothetical protein
MFVVMRVAPVAVGPERVHSMVISTSALRAPSVSRQVLAKFSDVGSAVFSMAQP